MSGDEKEIELTFRPLSSDNWKDLEALFGKSGAWGGCWCMWWRLASADFERQRGEENRLSLRKLVSEGKPIGVLAYVGNQPAGWCAVSPREDFPRLERSPILKRVDDLPSWSIVCFYISKGFRGKGLLQPILEGAVDYAQEQGAERVEGYPLEPRDEPYPAASAWTGFPAPFLRAGFKEIARRKPTRAILRCELLDAR